MGGGRLVHPTHPKARPWFYYLYVLRSAREYHVDMFLFWYSIIYLCAWRTKLRISIIVITYRAIWLLNIKYIRDLSSSLWPFILTKKTCSIPIGITIIRPQTEEVHAGLDYQLKQNFIPNHRFPVKLYNFHMNTLCNLFHQ